eukprot:TRINITY_DN10103_c0_g1_i1.p1 TRINITY_DN10103_c0_g1~~TRINITY_DN10103_c0_g1_i1.p1  ORF type:complete len:134 (-),score=17.16 TRINITY_DN10103_c0_g1_i1:97-498(-)
MAMKLPKPTPALTKARARALLTELIVAFSTRPFQNKLNKLLQRHTTNAGSAHGSVANVIPLQEIYHLEGREELVMEVQCDILPRYGFDDTAEGVQHMVQAMQPFLSDALIQEKMEVMKTKLSMPMGLQPARAG